jgi:hypothetical protein
MISYLILKREDKKLKNNKDNFCCYLILVFYLNIFYQLKITAINPVYFTKYVTILYLSLNISI